MRKLVISAISACLLFAACTEDTENDIPNEQGNWVVISATRGDRPTGTLNGAYFKFDTAASQLSTNFSGEDIVLPYTRDDGTLLIKGSPLLSAMRVETATDSTLRLTTEISGLIFTFDMVQQDAQANPM